MIYTLDLPLKALSINTHSSNKSLGSDTHKSSDCKHIQATQFSDQIPRTYSVTNFRQMSQQYFLPERMALNVEQTHQHFEDGFTQRNKRRNHHHNTSFRERCTGPVKLHINQERECLESRWTCSGTCHSRSVRYPHKHQRTDTSTPPAACLSRLDLVFQHRITRTREQKRR